MGEVRNLLRVILWPSFITPSQLMRPTFAYLLILFI